MRHLSWLFGLSLAFGWVVGCGGDSEFTGPAGGSGKSTGGGAGDDSGGSDASGGGSGKGGSGGGAGKGGSAGSSGKGGSSGSSGSGVTLEDLPGAYADAYCKLLERCGGILYDLTTAYEDCSTLATERVRQDGLSSLEQAIDDGRVVYHPELVPACIEAVTSRVCEDLNERDIEACNLAIEGTAAEGEPCTMTEECDGSLICETKDACPGTCVERYSAGVVCASSDECADGLVCSEATAHCVQPTRDGEACGGGVEAQCEAGFFCAGDDKGKMETGTCLAFDELVLGAEGDACDPETAKLCADGLSCVITGVANEALTWECQAKGTSGSACHLGLPEACPLGEFCPIRIEDVLLGTFEAECTPLPAIGEDCAVRPLPGILPDCVAYARCGDGKCVGLRELGQSCSGDVLCYSGHCVAGACEPGHTCDE